MTWLKNCNPFNFLSYFAISLTFALSKLFQWLNCDCQFINNETKITYLFPNSDVSSIFSSTTNWCFDPDSSNNRIWKRNKKEKNTCLIAFELYDPMNWQPKVNFKTTYSHILKLLIIGIWKQNSASRVRKVWSIIILGSKSLTWPTLSKARSNKATKN